MLSVLRYLNQKFKHRDKLTVIVMEGVDDIASWICT